MSSKLARKSKKPKGKQDSPSSPESEALDMQGIVQWVILSGILIVLLLRPIFDGRTFPASNPFFQLLLYALLFVWAGSIFLGKDRRISSPWPTLLLLLFLLTVMMGLQYSVSTGDTWMGVVEVGSYVALWILLANMEYKRDHLVGLFLVILVAAAFVTFYGFYQYFFGLFAEVRQMVLDKPEEAAKLLATFSLRIPLKICTPSTTRKPINRIRPIRPVSHQIWR